MTLYLKCRARAWSRLIAATAVVLASAAGSDLRAQQPAGATGLETIQLRDNVHVIFGAGGNITVHTGRNGVVLVDSGTGAMADDVLAAVRALSDRPIRLIINTSADLDHVGGNETLATSGAALIGDSFVEDEQAVVLAQENVLLRLSATGGSDAEVPVSLWPTETFTSRYRSMYFNDDAVQVIRQIGATSDGDVLVHFRRADVIVAGDVLDLRHFPIIDTAQGGTIQGELDALNRLLDLTVPAMPLVLERGRTLVVPGHGRVSDYAELVEYRDMLTVIRDIVRDHKSQGMTLEQVRAANPTAGYRSRWGRESGPWTTDMFVEAVYTTLPASREGS